MEPTKIKLEFTLEQINILISGLGKLPLEQSIQVFNLIQMEAQKQLTPKTEETK